MGIKNYKVYTPKEYANLMIDITLRDYFSGDYSKEKLDKIRVADLSCGTGNIILSMLVKLIKLSYNITGDYYFNPEWIHGYDVDKEAISSYRKAGLKILNDYGLSGDIIGFHKDSILENTPHKYNIVLGNPPYLGEKNHKEIFNEVRKTSFGKKHYESKMDYFYFFIEKGIDLLCEGGILTYVTTNYWLKADSAVILRKKLAEEGYFSHIIDYNKCIFMCALGQHNMIFSWKKNSKDSKDSMTLKGEMDIDVIKEEEEYQMKNKDLYDDNGTIVLLNKEDEIFNQKIKDKSNYLLKDIFNVNQGIVTGCDDVFVEREYNEKFKAYLKPFYKNKDVMKYSCKLENDFWLYYIKRGEMIGDDLKYEFLPYIDVLSQRREVRLDSIDWWELTWPRKNEVFCGEKILVRQRCKTNYFAYNNGEFFGSADIYYLTLKDARFNIFYLLGYLNSSTFYRWYKLNGKHKGYNLEFYSTPLKAVPIFYPDDDNLVDMEYIVSLVKKQIEEYSEEVQDILDELYMKIYSL